MESEPDDLTIEITQDDIEFLRNRFEVTWRRNPTSEELDTLITNLVRDEIMVREAKALRMDENDAVVRNRLRQKMDFIAASVSTAQPQTKEDLNKFYEANETEFVQPQQIAFQQILMDEGAVLDLNALFDDLNAGKSPKSVKRSSLLPSEMALSTGAKIDGVFGPGFAEGLEGMPIGTWGGPVRSAFGLHVVRVIEKQDAELQNIEEVEPQVIAKWREATQEEAKEAFAQRLEAKYQIIVAQTDQETD
ncbi:peptidyl-prolyl cis-trans isomerase [Ruegeria sp. Ofav3-42]|uniref:peptidylprolyl isomerase n=1 Tax=Ruegeria sp. Ofav3-42 TaxID=2917759 RepID=UPI001EF4EC0B|nr:peptidylprolyl isomerase [Ruegeria sp. Ofav3-42]MCG7522436.1 peptidyl-prolyl cis-trans isomerase [Ruegeria sp. Ofav3-42]